MWHLFVLLLCCSQVRSDWKLNLADWKDVPDNVAGFKPQSDLSMIFESDWILDFVLPKPDASARSKGQGSQKSKDPETVAFHVEQNSVHSSSPACSSILHETGHLIPMALENVMKSLYRPLNPVEEYSGFTTGYLASKAKRLSTRFSTQLMDMNYFTTAPGGSARTDHINEFPPPNVDSISIIIGDYEFGRSDFSVSILEPMDEANPSNRTMLLSLGWLRQSWENPLPWQTPEVRRRVLLELLTHELAQIYQYTRPDYLNVKKSNNRPPPNALIEGISKFVTLQADLPWQGVKTPDLLGDLPGMWDTDSEHTAYFLLWLENVRNGTGSIARLNDHISKANYWGRLKQGWIMHQEDTGIVFWKDLFGVTADALWDEYTAYVAKEGYLSPFKWASYSIRSITTIPQDTFRWLRRVFFTVRRSVSYWRRFTSTMLHLVFISSSGYMAMVVIPVIFACITLPIYKLAYDRIRKSRPHVGSPVSAFSSGVSLLLSGLFRGWHGVRLVASGMWMCLSGFLFLFWHTTAAILRVESKLYAFVSWAFEAVPAWFGHRVISLIWNLMMWIWLWTCSLSVVFKVLLDIPLSLIKKIVSWINSVLSWIKPWLTSSWSPDNSDVYHSESSYNSSSPLSPRNDSYSPSPSSSMPTRTIPRGRQIRSPSPPSSSSATPSPIHTLPPSPRPDISPSPPACYPDLPIQSTETSWEHETSYRSLSPPKEVLVLEKKEVQIQFEEKEVEEEVEDEYRIEEILRSRKYGKKLKYRVKWYGKRADQKWYDAGDLRYQPHMLQDFHAENPDQSGPPVRLLDWVHAAEDGVEPRTHPDDNLART